MSVGSVVVSRELEAIPPSRAANPFVQGATHTLYLAGVDRGVSVRLLGEGDEPLSWIPKWFQLRPTPHFVVRVDRGEGRPSQWVAVDQASARGLLTHLGAPEVEDVAGAFFSMAVQRRERALFASLGVEWTPEISDQIRLIANELGVDLVDVSRRCAELLRDGDFYLEIEDLPLWVRAQVHAEEEGVDFARSIEVMPHIINLAEAYGVSVEVVMDKMLKTSELSGAYVRQTQEDMTTELYWEFVQTLLYVHTHHAEWERALKSQPVDCPLRISSKESGGLLPRSIIYFKGSEGTPGCPMILFNQHGRGCHDAEHMDALLGEGSSARVKRMMDMTTGRFYAISVQRETPKAEKRYQIQRRFQGPGVASVMGKVSWDGSEGVRKEGCIMPLYVESLFDLLMRGALSREQRLRMGLEIAQALARMHAESVLHRDVKPENVLVGVGEDGQLHAYLADFEYAGPQSEACIAGTLPFIPPEFRKDHDVSHLSATERDAWALGVTLWFVFMPQIDKGKHFGDQTFIKYISKQVWRNPISEGWLGGGAAAADTEVEIVRGLLHPDPKQRLKAAEAAARLQGLIERASSPAPTTRGSPISLATSISSSGVVLSRQSAPLRIGSQVLDRPPARLNMSASILV